MQAFPSQTSTNNRPVCRFCLDGDESGSPLIRPCNCKGTVALVHSSCLERWVETQRNTVCQLCRVEYEQESAGWKRLSEWHCPRALSDEWEDRLDFLCAILWFLYVLRFLFLWLSIGGEETRKRIAEVVGEGHFSTLWWIGFWLNMLYYGAVGILIGEQWLADHRVYKFKDRCTEDERRQLQKTQSRMEVTSLQKTN